MRLYLDVTEGPNKGKKYSLTERTSFGRKGAEILLDDAKLSGVHVFFDYSKDTGWFVEDNKSRNGVWVNGHKEMKIVLKNGDLIQIGGTIMICRLQEAGSLNLSDQFMNWVESLFKKLKNHRLPVHLVNPEVRLKVIQGVQYGTHWDIYFGPRVAGLNSDDICLFDDKAPEKAFEVRLKGQYAYFYTDNESVVKMNGISVKEKQFIPGDVISFGETKIKVEIDDGNGFSN